VIRSLSDHVNLYLSIECATEVGSFCGWYVRGFSGLPKAGFYPVRPGDIALVHAAAGGLGLLLTQIIKLRGGHVIGRVSSTDKIAVTKEAGADHLIVDTEGRFAEEAVRLTADARIGSTEPCGG
jgi:NADPH:quinone reductase-like Zn-dependent oxidoreductase